MTKCHIHFVLLQRGYIQDNRYVLMDVQGHCQDMHILSPLPWLWNGASTKSRWGYNQNPSSCSQDEIAGNEWEFQGPIHHRQIYRVSVPILSHLLPVERLNR